MKILRVWLIAICLSYSSGSVASDFENKIAAFAQSPEWLGHFFYDGDQSGYTSLVESEYYFLSSTGKYNPTDELKEAIGRLSSTDEISEENYCHYLSRFELVLSAFPELRKPSHKCRAFEIWKQTLALDSVRLSFASGYIKNPASSFGHLFLKLRLKNQASESLGYGINFSAQTGDDTGALYALKGLLGQYPGGFVFLPYHQLIKDYSDLEGRDIWELDLELDEVGKDRLLLFIYEFDSHYIDYTFLNSNCAGILERLIYYVQRKPPLSSLQLKPWTIPLESFQNIAQGTNNRRFHYTPSLKTQLKLMESRLNETEKKLLKYETKSKKYRLLNSPSLDYALLDKKINETKLDENYYLEILNFRAGLAMEADIDEISMPLPLVTERARTSSVGLVLEQSGAGLDLNFLNEKMIYRHGLSEINLFNFHIRSNSEQRPVLQEVEIFNFLAGEPVNFLRTPLSYGGGLYYRHKKELSIEVALGYLLDLGHWLYFPKVQWMADKFQTRFSPQLDVFYFSSWVNGKLSINDQTSSLEVFKFINTNYSVQANVEYETMQNGIKHNLRVSYFY